jgi:hypothetical protein
MPSVTKVPGVSSILLFSGSGIYFPRPLYRRPNTTKLESSINRVPKGHFNIEKNTYTTVTFRFSHIVYIIGT